MESNVKLKVKDYILALLYLELVTKLTDKSSWKLPRFPDNVRLKINGRAPPSLGGHPGVSAELASVLRTHGERNAQLPASPGSIMATQ